jgi:hypothetical protein
MTVWVDRLQVVELDEDADWRTVWYKNAKLLCHMWADTAQELEKMAQEIGTPERAKKTNEIYGTHYVIAKTLRLRALMRGAVEGDAQDWLAVLRGANSDDT